MGRHCWGLWSWSCGGKTNWLAMHLDPKFSVKSSFKSLYYRFIYKFSPGILCVASCRNEKYVKRLIQIGSLPWNLFSSRPFLSADSRITEAMSSWVRNENVTAPIDMGYRLLQGLCQGISRLPGQTCCSEIRLPYPVSGSSLYRE